MDSEITQLTALKQSLSNEERSQFDLQVTANRKNPTTALLFSLFLGGVGADRFYIGHTGLGVGKLLTLGGLGMWALVDLFLIMKAARAVNAAYAKVVYDNIIQLRR